MEEAFIARVAIGSRKDTGEALDFVAWGVVKSHVSYREHGQYDEDVSRSER